MFKFKKSDGWGFLRTLRQEEFRWLTKTQMQSLSQYLIQTVLDEARRDRARFDQLPNTPKLNYSFSTIVEDDTIILMSDWPWLDAYVEGRPPHPMTWLTQQEGVYKVPMVQRDGTVLIRTAPLTIKDAWIHPGIARHTFVQRAFQKTLNRMEQMFFANLQMAWKNNGQS